MKNRVCTSVSSFVIATICSLSHAQPCSPNQDAMILPDDGAAGDAYGWAVAIDNDTAVVGSLYESNRGSAYVIDYNGSSWNQTQKIAPFGLGISDNFGDAVSISGSTLVVGSPGDDDAGSGAGAVYVFENQAGTWVQVAKLVPPSLVAGDNYGSSVEIDADTIVIGASLVDSAGSNSGKAFVYRSIAGVWTLEAELISSDIEQWDHFGNDVAISGNRVLIGADSDDDFGSGSGSAYVFERTGSVWTQTAKLNASDSTTNDQFAERLDISGDAIVIGMRYDNAVATWSGSAYIFEYDGANWNQTIKLIPPDGASSNFFGQDIAIDNGRAIIGAWGRKDPFGFSNAGASYIYSRTNAGWALDNKVLASDQEGGDFYGYSVDITTDHAIVGADGNDDYWWGPDVGSAYIIALNCQTQCPADLTADGNLDFFDVSAFLTAFSNDNPIADFTGDGNFDFFDVSAFLTAFAVGCP